MNSSHRLLFKSVGIVGLSLFFLILVDLTGNSRTANHVSAMEFPSDPSYYGLATPVADQDTPVLTDTTAKIIYVDVSNKSGFEDGTPAYPFDTIQEGLGIALSGDTVRVAPGTYYESFTMKSGVKLLGAGASVTTLDGTGQDDTVIYVSYTGPGTLIDGFTITHGTGRHSDTGWYTYGGAIYAAHATFELRNCYIVDNSATDGSGGIHASSSSITINGCIFADNVGWWGGSVLLGDPGNSLIENSIFVNGACNYGGGIILGNGAQATIINNLILQTGAPAAIWISNTTATIINNTIVDNYGNGISGDNPTEPVIIKNTILWGNTDDLNNVSATYSDIQDGDLGEGNISTYPLFVDSANHDYHLRPISLLIDAGTNDGAPEYDLDGHIRPFDGNNDGIKIVDIGAYEFSNNHLYLSLILK